MQGNFIAQIDVELTKINVLNFFYYKDENKNNKDNTWRQSQALYR